MKKLLPLSRCLIVVVFFSSLLSPFSILKAQTTAPKSTTFHVCDVQQKPVPYQPIAYRNVVDRVCGTGTEAWSKGTDSLVYWDINPVIATVREAFLDHRPLTLSPDQVWLMIAQQFAIHVDKNAESLRHYFVDFNGKKVLKVRNDDLRKGYPDSPWDSVFPKFVAQIGENCGQTLLDNTMPEFTTTTNVTRVASSITLMDAMSSYFVYAVYTSIGCGIPSFTLEGTTADWEKLREKANALGKYDFKWWTDSISPILDQFVDASKGKVDKEFWSRIYDITYHYEGGGYGSQGHPVPEVSGWILKFFPYMQDGNGGFTRRTNFMQPVRDPKQFPKGFANADFYWYYDDNGDVTVYQMQFIAGFMGMKIDRKTGALTPYVGWVIKDTGDKGIKSEDAANAQDIMLPPKPKDK